MKLASAGNPGILLAIATVLSLSAGQADAQTSAQNRAAVPLKGAINHDYYKQDRLERISPQSAFSNHDSKFKGYLKQPVRLSRQEAKLAAGSSSSSLTGLVDTAGLNKTADEAPYIWEQSRGGGYYDRTGNIKRVVPGQELSRYGGRFADGSPVKDWVNTNHANHVYWQPGLSHPYFKRMR